MRYFITGGAGFIGSTLADRLLESGSKVVVYDNFIAGFEEFLEDAQKSPNFTLIRGDCSNPFPGLQVRGRFYLEPFRNPYS